jgi:hypothetical protein
MSGGTGIDPQLPALKYSKSQSGSLALTLRNRRGMRTLLTLSLLFASLLPATGCLPIGGCGAFNGNTDKVYARGSDSLILCSNGGFVANVSSGAIEGRYMENAVGSDAAGFGIRGENGQLAFDLYTNADGSIRTPQLGETAWQDAKLDQYALDHADVQCTDLVNRTWWTAQ